MTVTKESQASATTLALSVSTGDDLSRADLLVILDAVPKLSEASSPGSRVPLNEPFNAAKRAKQAKVFCLRSSFHVYFISDIDRIEINETGQQSFHPR